MTPITMHDFIPSSFQQIPDSDIAYCHFTRIIPDSYNIIYKPKDSQHHYDIFF